MIEQEPKAARSAVVVAQRENPVTANTANVESAYQTQVGIFVNNPHNAPYAEAVRNDKDNVTHQKPNMLNLFFAVNALQSSAHHHYQVQNEISDDTAKAYAHHVQNQMIKLSEQAAGLVSSYLHDSELVSANEMDQMAVLIQQYNHLNYYCNPQNWMRDFMDMHKENIKEIMGQTEQIMDLNPSKAADKFMSRGCAFLAAVSATLTAISGPAAPIFGALTGICLLVGYKCWNTPETNKHEYYEKTKESMKELVDTLGKVPDVIGNNENNRAATVRERSP